MRRISLHMNGYVLLVCYKFDFIPWNAPFCMLLIGLKLRLSEVSV